MERDLRLCAFGTQLEQGAGEGALYHRVQPLPRDSVPLRIQLQTRLVKNVDPPVHAPADDQEAAALDVIVE